MRNCKNFATDLIAIIPARIGSKGLSAKNIKPLLGVPLIAYTIQAALKSKCFKEVFVTTDGPEIARVSRCYGAKVIDRPASLATDSSVMTDVLCHCYHWLLENVRTFGKVFCLLQPTSPLRHEAHIQECITLFQKSFLKSAVSVCENIYSPFKSLQIKNNTLKPLFNENFLHLNRQALKTTYRQNGAIYIAAWQDLITTKQVIQFPAMPYFMKECDSIDIDSTEDFEIATQLLKKINK